MGSVENHSAASRSIAPNVAIIGTEGAGKTVLTTTLAKRLSSIDSRGIFLNPQGVKTLKYVEKVWQTLQSGEWPPSTPPGELFELNWKLQIVGEAECDVRLIDAAGQDLRLLFGDEQINSLDSLPGHLRSLAEYCRSAEIVLFLVNLKDFIGESNAEQRTANEAAIKSAMDYLSKNISPRRLCLVLTQTDLYETLAEERGGWLELVAEMLPYVFGAHVRSHHLSVFPVSAVAETSVVTDSDGTARRVPSEGFQSEGLDDLINWLAEQVKEVGTELDEQRKSVPALQEEVNQIPGMPPPLPAGSTSDRIRRASWKMIHGTSAPLPAGSADSKPPASKIQETIGAIVVFILIATGAFFLPKSCGRSPVESPVATPPPRPAVTTKWGYTWGVIKDDLWLENTSSMTITNVEFTVYLRVNGKLVTNPIVLHEAGIYPGQRKTWVNVMRIPREQANAIDRDNTSYVTIVCDQNR
ncbi:MAG: hypothetical protein WD768_23330 [Phycisphaeraceae bacterium]